jgi:hypothetical protein
MQIITLGIGAPGSITPLITSGLEVAFAAGSFVVNNTHIERITRGDWTDAPAGVGLDGKTGRQRWVSHVWQSNVMSAEEFNSLYSLEGQKVSIKTTNYADRNGDYITYYGVDFKRISGEHAGPIFTGVTCEFLVRL